MTFGRPERSPKARDEPKRAPSRDPVRPGDWPYASISRPAALELALLDAASLTVPPAMHCARWSTAGGPIAEEKLREANSVIARLVRS